MLAVQRALREVRKLRADVEKPEVPTSAEARAQRHLAKLAKKDPIAALLKREGFT
jgi:hypothetical protein